MPTYSYRCTECDNAFDIQQSFTDDTLSVCPVCGGKLRKVFSPIGVTFNGSGFYRNDSRATSSSSDGPKKSSEKSSEKSSGPSSKPSESSSKPATTSTKPASGSSGSSSTAA
ncbi:MULTISPECIES: FmdB family zinc ribbon protein [Subtercola]|uniref:FmdB family transcriptional regulator n=1 Tax=Subtercola vilae TaxID=2056433 RepID=A0A4T2BTC4_9MICO|nr:MULTISPECIES: FmdB family zinc ribbon protein [Subtercola]MEA9986357.1 zinc ribbon domain-containing protein [Subtercola sp. RTI3]TIH35003.1 FmdB family transcriptional regulator [Subtercola vilae]